MRVISLIFTALDISDVLFQVIHDKVWSASSVEWMFIPIVKMRFQNVYQKADYSAGREIILMPWYVSLSGIDA